MNFEKDRRNSPRVQLKRQAKLEFNTNIYENCWINNSSLLGMFIHGDFQQFVGDKCVVKFVQKRKHSSLSLEVAAQVVRKEDQGVAIAYTSISLESLMPLQMILSCEDNVEPTSSEIESFDKLPYEVHDDLIRSENCFKKKTID